MSTKIAIAIATRNRRPSCYQLMESLAIFMPDNCDVFLVDDASDVSYCNPDYRFTERVGISAVKNKCLQLAYESGAEHIFLMDDDVRVLKKDWHLPYINSGEHHLCATFYEPWKTENGLNIHRLANGYCLYMSRECIETVGGFDTNYNNKYEHCDLSRRIYNARLTNHIYQDVVGSSELIYCLDEHNEIPRSFTNREMQDNLKSGYEYFKSQENSSRYIEFRT